MAKMPTAQQLLEAKQARVQVQNTLDGLLEKVGTDSITPDDRVNIVAQRQLFTDLDGKVTHLEELLASEMRGEARASQINTGILHAENQDKNATNNSASASPCEPSKRKNHWRDW